MSPEDKTAELAALVAEIRDRVRARYPNGASRAGIEAVLASIIEPGTFDLATMINDEYPGVSLALARVKISQPASLEGAPLLPRHAMRGARPMLTSTAWLRSAWRSDEAENPDNSWRLPTKNCGHHSSSQLDRHP